MNLIYDRTEADKTETKRILTKLQTGEVLTETEQTAYDAGLKGCYNTKDLNRVEVAVAELATALNNYGYPNITVPHTWTDNEIVTAAQWTQYITNVQALIDSYYTLADTPALPSAADRLTYTGANAIEHILTDIDTLIGWMEHSTRYCSAFTCGDNAAHLPLQRSVT